MVQILGGGTKTARMVLIVGDDNSILRYPHEATEIRRPLADAPTSTSRACGAGYDPEMAGYDPEMAGMTLAAT